MRARQTKTMIAGCAVALATQAVAGVVPGSFKGKELDWLLGKALCGNVVTLIDEPQSDRTPVDETALSTLQALAAGYNGAKYVSSSDINALNGTDVPKRFISEKIGETVHDFHEACKLMPYQRFTVIFF